MLENLILVLISDYYALILDTKKKKKKKKIRELNQLPLRHCPKLQSCAITRKTNDKNLKKWQRTYFRAPNISFREFYLHW